MKKFHISDVLSVTTGRLVSTRHIDGIYDILNFLTGDKLFTHALPRASGECKPWLKAQFPQLFPDEPETGKFVAAVADIAESDAGREERDQVLKQLCEELARDLGLPLELDVYEMPEDMHTVIGPVEELSATVGDDKVLVVNTPAEPAA